MAFKVGITRFLGTNCDEDIKKWTAALSFKSDYLWFEDQFDINSYDMVIIPGGFSHGDYLRCHKEEKEILCPKRDNAYKREDTFWHKDGC